MTRNWLTRATTLFLTAAHSPKIPAFKASNSTMWPFCSRRRSPKVGNALTWTKREMAGFPLCASASNMPSVASNAIVWSRRKCAIGNPDSKTLSWKPAVVYTIFACVSAPGATHHSNCISLSPSNRYDLYRKDCHGALAVRWLVGGCVSSSRIPK